MTDEKLVEKVMRVIFEETFLSGAPRFDIKRCRSAAEAIIPIVQGPQQLKISFCLAALESNEREIAYVRERQELDLALANKFRSENAALRTRISELEKNAVDKRQIENQDQDRDQATHRRPPWEMSRI
jgi:hypothetical protein